MKRLLSIVLIVMLALYACKSESNNRKTSIDNNNLALSSITAVEANLILEQLEVMLKDACERAEQLKENGVNSKNLRDSLRVDSAYILIAREASMLDSILLNYMVSSIGGGDLRIKYNAVVARNLKRVQKAGLK